MDNPYDYYKSNFGFSQETQSYAFMDQCYNYLSVDSALTVSNKWPVIGEQVTVIVMT